MLINTANIVAGNEHNSRTGDPDIKSLIKSMKENGLILPIAVRKLSNTELQIVDGHRRFAAALELGWTEIPVHIVDGESDANAATLSLVANIERLPLHPVEQYEAFARLRDIGLSPADIARKFALAKKQVSQVLALGALHRVILDAWKTGKIEEDQARAFTLGTPSQQFAAWSKLKKGDCSAWAIRRHLNVQSHRHLLDFVGEKNFLRAGGEITVNLFADKDEDPRLINDDKLLERLVGERLEQEAAHLRNNGWPNVARGEDAWPDGAPDLILANEEIERPESGHIEWLATVKEAQRRKLWLELYVDEDSNGVLVDVFRERSKKEKEKESADEDADAREKSERYASHDRVPEPEAEVSETGGAAELSNSLKQDVLKWRTAAYRRAFILYPEAWLRFMVHAGRAEWCTPFKFHRDLEGKGDWRTDATAAGNDFIGDLAEAFTPCLDTSGCSEADMIGLIRYFNPSQQDVLRSLLVTELKHDEFMERVPRSVLTAIVLELEAVVPIGGMKKKDAAARVAEEASKRAWLPPLMRVGGFEKHLGLLEAEAAA